MKPWCVDCWTGKDQSSSYFSVLAHTFLYWKENLHNQGVNSHEQWHKISKLTSQSALISQLYLHFFQKLKYYTLGNKDYSRKLFSLWQLSLSNLLMRRYEASLRIQEQGPQGFHGRVYRNHYSLRVFKILIWLISDYWIHNYSRYYGPKIPLYWLNAFNEHKQTWNKNMPSSLSITITSFCHLQ